MKIGIDIGGSHIGIGLINADNKIINLKNKDFINEEKQEIKNNLEYILINTIEELLTQSNLEKKHIEKIGVAIPGRADENGNIYTVNLNLKKYPIKNILQNYFKVPIQIRNDAKCSAICEKEYGSLKKYKDSVFLCLGTGIGSAVFLQNKLLTTSTSESFEIGHMIIQKDGKLCNCGKRGCFEQYASMRILKNEIIKTLDLRQNISGEEILNIICEQNKNEKLQDILQEYINNLSIGILNIMEIFEPEAICIGGSFVHFEEILLEKLRIQIKKQNHIAQKIPEILLAKMGNNAGIIGSIL